MLVKLRPVRLLLFDLSSSPSFASVVVIVVAVVVVGEASAASSPGHLPSIIL